MHEKRGKNEKETRKEVSEGKKKDMKKNKRQENEQQIKR